MRGTLTVTYELSAASRVVLYTLAAVLLVVPALVRRYRPDGWGVLLLALLAGNSLLAFLGVSRTFVGAVATPIACLLCAYVLMRQKRS